jgi:hypothetical protein
MNGVPPPEADVVDGDDVRVVERAEDLRLALQPAHVGRAAVLAYEHLDGDAPAELLVAAQQHAAHAAAADLALGHVAIGEPQREGDLEDARTG